MKQRYVYDLCDISDGINNEEWINSFRCYSDVKDVIKKILRITNLYFIEFVKFTDIKVKDNEIISLEFEVIDDNEELRKFIAYKTILTENIKASRENKRLMYI